ncbi:MAG: isoprenylcysteine carboxylmethyltransferase family protein [Cryobacterium sp.]|nr:isoprenylcysteine carboxylmethyltransferase family protein [Cryobacterium sp.]MBX3103891.1 isoprenylcysteine carboxylmethyltransferase family protein [Cryobacterium sp.]
MKRSWALALVVLQLALIAALFIEPFGALWPRNTRLLIVAAAIGSAGLLIASLGILGLGASLSPSPIPKQGAQLVTTGIYGWIRNPIYSGLLVASLGIVLFGASRWHIATWVALLALLICKARLEERMLFKVHPEFAKYAATVGRFIPGIGKLRKR